MCPNRGGRRPGAGRPRRKIQAVRTNLALSQEVRELLALAGDGNMSRGAERLALAWARARLLYATDPPARKLLEESYQPYRCPQCGALANVWASTDVFSNTHTLHWRCWRGHEGEIKP